MIESPAAAAVADPASAVARTGHAGALSAVLFDMDGLLVDTEPLWFEVECDVMRRLGCEWTPQDQHALVGGSLERSVGYMLGRATRPASPEQVSGWLIAGMARLLADREVAPMPGAVELIAELRAAGIPHALVTSSEAVIMDAALTGLASVGVRFAVTVCGADVRHTKPHPEPYLLAATLLGADPRCCVALEDSPSGVASAQAAGCATIAVPGIAPVLPRPGLTIVPSLAAVSLAMLRSLIGRPR